MKFWSQHVNLSLQIVYIKQWALMGLNNIDWLFEFQHIIRIAMMSRISWDILDSKLFILNRMNSSRDINWLGVEVGLYHLFVSPISVLLIKKNTIGPSNVNVHSRIPIRLLLNVLVPSQRQAPKQKTTVKATIIDQVYEKRKPARKLLLDET